MCLEYKARAYFGADIHEYRVYRTDVNRVRVMKLLEAEGDCLNACIPKSQRAIELDRVKAVLSAERLCAYHVGSVYMDRIVILHDPDEEPTLGQAGVMVQFPAKFVLKTPRWRCELLSEWEDLPPEVADSCILPFLDCPIPSHDSSTRVTGHIVSSMSNMYCRCNGCRIKYGPASPSESEFRMCGWVNVVIGTTVSLAPDGECIEPPNDLVTALRGRFSNGKLVETICKIIPAKHIRRWLAALPYDRACNGLYGGMKAGGDEEKSAPVKLKPDVVVLKAVPIVSAMPASKLSGKKLPAVTEEKEKWVSDCYNFKSQRLQELSEEEEHVRQQLAGAIPQHERRELERQHRFLELQIRVEQGKIDEDAEEYEKVKKSIIAKQLRRASTSAAAPRLNDVVHDAIRMPSSIAQAKQAPAPKIEPPAAVKTEGPQSDGIGDGLTFENKCYLPAPSKEEQTTVFDLLLRASTYPWRLAWSTTKTTVRRVVQTGRIALALNADIAAIPIGLCDHVFGTNLLRFKPDFWPAAEQEEKPAKPETHYNALVPRQEDSLAACKIIADVAQSSRPCIARKESKLEVANVALTASYIAIKKAKYKVDEGGDGVDFLQRRGLNSVMQFAASGMALGKFQLAELLRTDEPDLLDGRIGSGLSGRSLFARLSEQANVPRPVFTFKFVWELIKSWVVSANPFIVPSKQIDRMMDSLRAQMPVIPALPDFHHCQNRIRCLVSPMAAQFPSLPSQ